MPSRIMLGNPLQQFRGAESRLAVLVEEAQSDVEETRLGFGGDAEEEADFVVGADVPGKGVVDVAALGGGEALGAEAVVQVAEVEAFEGADGVELGYVL